MSTTCFLLLSSLVFQITLAHVPAPPPPSQDPKDDSRWIPNGAVLRSGGYSCQPYCSVLPDGVWSCVMTYIHAPVWIEGQPGEHMVSMRTKDQGKTWDDFVTIEPYSNVTTGQVSAYGSIAARKDGSRVFSLWIQNVHNISNLPGQPSSPKTFRADMLGNFVWKYSDDQGLTWSEQHYIIPVPFNYIETINSFSKVKNGTGDVQIMWEVDHLKTMSDGTLLFAFTKIGTYDVAPPEEIFILSSKNILTEDDPTLVVWDMWPHGDHGIGAVGAPDDPTIITEEPHVVPIMNDKMLYIVWRTSQGYMGHTQTKKGAEGDFSSFENWELSTFAEYLPTWADQYVNASWVKHPRGPLSPKQQPNGLVLMTFYNTAPLGAFATHMKVNDRNNMWLTVGHEMTNDKTGRTTLMWTQPELALYERDHTRGHGYPDVITDLDGSIYITETYKSTPQSEAKTHTVDMRLVDMLYQQRTINETTERDLFVNLTQARVVFSKGDISPLPNFYKYNGNQYGFSVDVWISPSKSVTDTAMATAAPIVLVSAFDTAMATAVNGGGGSGSGGGMSVHYFKLNGTAQLTMIDQTNNRVEFSTDPICSQRLMDVATEPHHLGIIVDGGPKMIQFVVDGKLCDGGPDLKHWPNGHHLIDENFGDIGKNVNGMTVNLDIVQDGHLYNRSLFVTEMIGNWRAGPAV